MIEDLIARLESGDDEVADEIADLAVLDPQAVAPHLKRVLDTDVLWRAHVLYRAADESFQRHLVNRIETEPELAGRLVYVLALTRGAPAQEAFRRWATQPAEGIDPFGRGVTALARDGGWEFTEEGVVRELNGTAAYRLVPAEEEVSTPGTCPWCASPLWTALDVNTEDTRVAEALAHTGWRGRLRIVTCHFCSCYGTTFTDVTPDGGSVWSARTTRPDYLPDGPPEDPPALGFAVGERGPLLAGAWDRGGSRLGGFADWIQDPCYPLCPSCDRAMDYVGLVGGADLDEYGEGAYYLYLHAPCGLAAVEYQQS